MTPTTAAHRSAKLLAAATAAPLPAADEEPLSPLALLESDEVDVADDEEAVEERVRVAELMVVLRYMAVPVAALPLAPAPVPTAPVGTTPVPKICVAIVLVLTAAVVVTLALATGTTDGVLIAATADEMTDATDDAADTADDVADEPEDEADRPPVRVIRPV